MQIGAFGARQEVVGSGQLVGPAFEVERPAGIAPRRNGREGRLGRVLRTLRCSGRWPGRISSPSRPGPDDAHLRAALRFQVTRCAKAGSSTALALSGSAVMT